MSVTKKTKTTKPKTKPFSMRLSEETRAKLQVRAEAFGLTESDFGRMIILEKLNESASPLELLATENRLLASIIIAALSNAYSLEDARVLIEDHLIPTAIPVYPNATTSELPPIVAEETKVDITAPELPSTNSSTAEFSVVSTEADSSAVVTETPPVTATEDLGVGHE